MGGFGGLVGTYSVRSLCSSLSFSPPKDADTCATVRSFEQGDRIFIEQSQKFSPARVESLAASAGFGVSRRWENDHFLLIEMVPDVVGEAHDAAEQWFRDV